MELEGIILSKTKYKDRHLVCRLLCRSSSKVSAIFYGGQGGGKRNKPSQLEVGNLIQFSLAGSRSKSYDLKSVKEWKVLWAHEKVKKNYRAYFLLSFFLEVIDKVSIDDGNEFEKNLESESLFKLLSNAIYYLEKSVVEKDFEMEQHLTLFLGKLIYYSGIYPHLESCFYCSESLGVQSVSTFHPQDGAFVCEKCDSKNTQKVKSYQELWYLLLSAKQTSYRSYTMAHKGSKKSLEKGFEYFLGQFQLSKAQIKSCGFIFH